MRYVRFKVTACLYLSPNIRARSLSTLMAVIVDKDTPHNVGCVPCVLTETPVFVKQGHIVSSHDRLAKNAIQQVSCCQTTIRVFVKGKKDKRNPKTGYEGEENINCWVVDGLWLKSIYQRRSAPSSVRFVSAIILQSYSFFLQNTYDRKRKYFVLRAPAQRWSLKLYFFQNNHMKTFSVAFTRLKCSEILSVVYKKKKKKNGEPFFWKPYFCLSYDLSTRGKNKTSANVDIL